MPRPCKQVLLPDQGVGAVVLTNADTGGYLTGFFQRRLLEVLFDGRPEAVEQVKVAVAERVAETAKYRERLRRKDDGSTSFFTIDPSVGGFSFVVGEREGKKALIIRDAQHEYAFVEAGP